MKLSTKTTLFYLIFSIPLFFLGSWLLYSGIERSLLREVDEELLNSKELWVNYINGQPDSTDFTTLNIPLIKISKAGKEIKADHFSDTALFQEIDNEMVPYRVLTSYFNRNGQPYKLTSQYTLVEKDDVIKNIVRLMGSVFLGLLLVFLLINYFINKIVWKPFNSTLAGITTLNMQDLQNIHFEKTAINEFAALNKALKGMTEKIHKDYLSMKTFTENASHEIQTPLAIIQSKLELLIQDESVTQQQSLAISAASDASQRLSKLNQTLLLITKIENNQFKPQGLVSAQEVIEKYVHFFEELMEKKQIIHEFEILQDMKLAIHPMLMDTLISNLVSNAVRYNRPQGKLMITLRESNLVVKNESLFPSINPAHLFERFSKQDNSTGNGLGLAIVKEICDANGLTIQYAHENNFHQFTISKQG